MGKLLTSTNVGLCPSTRTTVKGIVFTHSPHIPIHHHKVTMVELLTSTKVWPSRGTTVKGKASNFATHHISLFLLMLMGSARAGNSVVIVRVLMLMMAGMTSRGRGNVCVIVHCTVRFRELFPGYVMCHRVHMRVMHRRINVFIMGGDGESLHSRGAGVAPFLPLLYKVDNHSYENKPKH